MTAVILFVFGAIIGSFLNVLALRLNTGLSLGGRSACSSCRHSLVWYELVPILSFLGLRGRCLKCKVRISWQYPLVEFLAGLLFMSLYLVYGFTVHYLLFTTVFCLYLVIAVYDIRHKIIPDFLVYLTILLSVVGRWLDQGLLLGDSTIDLLAGPLLFIFFAGLWFITRGRAIGFGDAKLALSVGLLLGAATGFSGVILGFWIGALWGLGLMALGRVYPLLTKGKRITMKSELPFAPFLILGAWLSVVFSLDLLHVALF